MNLSSKSTVLSFSSPEESNDRVAMVYRCQLKIEQLQDTADPTVKFCGSCKQSVFRVNDIDDVENMVASRRCVWGVNTAGTVHDDPRSCFLGMPAIDRAPTGPLQWED